MGESAASSTPSFLQSFDTERHPALRCAQDPAWAAADPLVRASPVPREHEGIRDVPLLRSTLEPTPVEIGADVLYVVDNTVTTGAAFAAFSTALRERWPGVRAVMLALVFSPKCETEISDR